MERRPNLTSEAAMRKKWLWAGVDMGVDSASVCIIDDAGAVLHEGVCRSSVSDVRHELASFRRSRYAGVGFEAGGGICVARGMRSLGYPVELYETRQLSKFLRVRRNKTDAGDAHGIAEAGRIGSSVVSRVYIKSLDCQAIQSRLTIRKQLIRQRIATYNLLARQIELYGGRLSAKSARGDLGRAVKGEIKKIFRNQSRELVADLQGLVARCEQLTEYQRTIDLKLKKVASDIEVCKRFMKIPGVGPICALSFYAGVGDPHRFTHSTAVGSYFGLAPKIHESGLFARKPRISKMGNKNVRSALVHSATVFVANTSVDSALRQWAVRLQERSGRAASRVALARKLAVIMLAMWKSDRPFELFLEPSAG